MVFMLLGGRPQGGHEFFSGVCGFFRTFFLGVSFRNM